MVDVKLIQVEVAYARPDVQRIITVNIAEGSTIHAVILSSGILAIFPEIDLARQMVGIFSQQKLLTDIVKEGDRVEIYRPLIIDPKDARKKRAAKKIFLKNSLMF